jgi:hypothetical protein
MVGAGDSNSDLQFACSSGSEEMQRRGREEMPRIPAPPTAADGAAFALSDIRWAPSPPSRERQPAALSGAIRREAEEDRAR